MNLCKCGCGREIVSRISQKFNGTPEYIWGHNSKGKKFKKTEEQRIRNKEAQKKRFINNFNSKSIHLINKMFKKPMQLCKCGCGMFCDNLYIHGHNNKNKKFIRTDKHKDNISKSLIGKLSGAKGIHWTEESKNKLRNRHPSENTRQKMREKRRLQITPTKDTKIEVKIQDFLKQLNIDFYTHQYMNIEHGYQCDIYIPSMNLVIECDGDYWHKYPTRTDMDYIRTHELIQNGFKVLRLWEREIKEMNVETFKKQLVI